MRNNHTSLCLSVSNQPGVCVFPISEFGFGCIRILRLSLSPPHGRAVGLKDIVLIRRCEPAVKSTNRPLGKFVFALLNFLPDAVNAQ